MQDPKTFPSSRVDILIKRKWCTFSGIMVAPGNFYNDVSKDWSCKWVLSNERIHVFCFTINITFTSREFLLDCP